MQRSVRTVPFRNSPVFDLEGRHYEADETIDIDLEPVRHQIDCRIPHVSFHD